MNITKYLASDLYKMMSDYSNLQQIKNIRNKELKMEKERKIYLKKNKKKEWSIVVSN